MYCYHMKLKFENDNIFSAHTIIKNSFLQAESNVNAYKWWNLTLGSLYLKFNFFLNHLATTSRWSILKLPVHVCVPSSRRVRPRPKWKSLRVIRLAIWNNLRRIPHGTLNGIFNCNDLVKHNVSTSGEFIFGLNFFNF